MAFSWGGNHWRLRLRLSDALAPGLAGLPLGVNGLPTALPPGLDPGALVARMRLDKKNVAGRLRLVLWRGMGRAEVVPDVDEAAVLAVLRAG